MSKLQYVKPEPILLKEHPEFTEAVARQIVMIHPSWGSAIPTFSMWNGAPKAGRLDLLHFTKVLDEVVLGQDEEDSAYTPPSRTVPYWEKKGIEGGLVGIVDECLGILKANNPKLELSITVLHRPHRGWKAQQLCRVPRQEAVCPGRGVTR